MSLNERVINIAPEEMSVGIYADPFSVGRSEWSPGPWVAEDFDWGTWTDAQTGFVCAIKRNHSGSWCGYVVIAHDHPVNAADAAHYDTHHYGSDLTAGNPVWLEVHGGVTFHGIWGLEEASLSGWAVGFDCNHAFDMSPRHTALRSGEYRNFAYVVAEVRALAKQIAEYEPLKQLISGPETHQEV